ncbi:MAG: hypothetical protein U0103_18520 [Candidatus Obscuribacterales bacterium]|nr:hypothetical protein [Cyanobacteria bacterium SZAS LIN-5]RTL38499.1 MAG: hypothetical protein EKK48_21570 [Candidatus Melainabacteria bacterium]
MRNLSTMLGFVALSSVAVLAFGVPTHAEKPSAAPSTDAFAKMDRAQTLVYNLNHVANSTGFYLLQDIRGIDTMDHDLTKALRQVQEVDKTFNRLRGNPDNRSMQAVSIKIEKALNSRAIFEEDLKDAYITLKSAIEETLVSDTGKKK